MAFAIVALTGCAEAPFGEGPPLDEECGGVQGIAAGNGVSLEVGRLQGSTFVPLVGGEMLELSVSGNPYGWGFLAAVRYPLESPPPRRTSCLGFQAFEAGPVGTTGIALSPGHPARWVEDPTTPSIGRWESVGEALIVVGADLEMLLAAPRSISIGASVEGFAQRSPEIMMRFTNREGWLAD